MRIVGFIPADSAPAGIFEQPPDEGGAVKKKKTKRGKKDEVNENADNGAGVSET